MDVVFKSSGQQLFWWPSDCSAISIENAYGIGDFFHTHSFVVVRKLTVDCLLGVDFLTQYGAVIDCVRNTLSLNSTRSSLPLIAPATPLTPIIAAVTVPETTQIPARTKRLISCRIQYPGMIVG